MGYYSDVRSIIYGPTKRMNALIAAHRMSDGPCVFDAWFKDNISIDVNETSGVTHIELSLEGVKWYDDDKYVTAWRDLLDLAASDLSDGELSYEFVRLGEELNDIETESVGNHDGYLWVDRCIRSNF